MLNRTASAEEDLTRDTVTTSTVLPEIYQAKEEHDDAEDDTTDQLWRHI